MAYTNPSITDFKTRFDRDFPFSTDINVGIRDTDIANAYQMTNFNLNQGLFSNQSNYTLGYLLLAAHYLVLNARAWSQGINGQFAWLEQNKAVGSVNTSFAIPQQILDNPYWSIFSKTNYGMEYLNLLLPQLIGKVGIAIGSTRP